MDEATVGALGCVETPRGRLPLAEVSVRADVWGPDAQVTVRQVFVNAFDVALEASYVFPLPDRAAVQKCVATLGSKVIRAQLFERGEAREKYAEAKAQGHRAALVEEDRPGCFTSTLGNLPPGENAVIELRYALELPIADGEVTFRFPLVIAPRFTPGTPLPGPSVGAGTAVDTNAVPDASRVTPPVLLPGSPNPVRLSLEVAVHHAGVAPDSLRAPLHAVDALAEPRVTRVRLLPGERLDRDFILRYRLLSAGARSHAFVATDAAGGEGTWQLCFTPPEAGPRRPLDVAFLLDRSGSMKGWKLGVARAALATMIDTLEPADRFALYAFDTALASPLPDSLVEATPDHRALAARFLERLTADGGTELAPALKRAVALPWTRYADRDAVVVLITDGQVTNEDELLRIAGKLKGVRVCAVGIDQAVNEALLRRLAELTAGTVELVESEQRLHEALTRIAHTARPPALAEITVTGDGVDVIASQTAPSRPPSAWSSDVQVLRGRFRGSAAGSLVVTGRRGDGAAHREVVPISNAETDAVAALWARHRVRALEDQYAVDIDARDTLRNQLVETSLRFNVLCRFTAFFAVDASSRVEVAGHLLMQPVEPVEWAYTTRGAFTGHTTRVKVPLLRGGRASAASRVARTQAGVLKGKNAYLSPEQVRGQPLDPRHEVFVLGAMLFELLTGRRLFMRDSEFAILEAVRNADLPDPLPNEILPELATVLRRALAADPARRYCDGAELAAALGALGTALPPSPTLADFVMASCPKALETLQGLLAKALATRPPAHGSCVLVESMRYGPNAEHWLGVRSAADGSPEPVVVHRAASYLDDPEWLEAFVESASFAATHPNLVRVLGVGDDFVVEELVRGVDLAALCRMVRGPIPSRLAVEIIAAAASALAFTNTLPDDTGALAGALHRELDPTQVMVGFDGSVKVLGTGAPSARRYAVPPMHLTGVAGPRTKRSTRPTPPAPRDATPAAAVAPPPRTFGDRLLALFRPNRDAFWK
jgi:Ca-activated chloride channel family protein